MAAGTTLTVRSDAYDSPVLGGNSSQGGESDSLDSVIVGDQDVHEEPSVPTRTVE